MITKRSLIVLAAAGILLSRPLGLRAPAQTAGRGEQKTIAVLGSSMAAGWVTSRTAKHDMENGYAQRLGRLLGRRGFRVVNISAPGDTTQKVLARLDKDLFPLNADFVIIGLSLENEGIRGLWENPSDQVYAGFKAGLSEMIRRCREHGIVPILGTCYPNNNFTQAGHYRYIKDMNMEIGTWDVPSINLLGALDNGNGQFVPGITFDLDHPADRGHQELFLSVVPSLFQALAAGKPRPVKDTRPLSTALGKTGSNAVGLSHVPTDPVRSFTMVLDVFPESEGILITMLDLDGAQAVLSIGPEGNLVYRATSGESRVVRASLLDRAWHQIGIIHHGLKDETVISIDGLPSGAVSETLCPVQFSLGGEESARADCRDWLIYRAPLNSDEMKRIFSGALIQSSLEVYAPLRAENPRSNREAVNRAQSLAKVIFSPSDPGKDIARLKADWNRQEEEEKIFFDPQEKKALFVPPEALEACAGSYDGPPGLVLTVERIGDRLWLHLNGGKVGTIELLPLSPERYFARSVGPEIEVVFSSADGTNGRATSLILRIDKQEIPAKRTSPGAP